MAARAKGALPFAYYAEAPPPPTTTCEKNKPGPSTRAASQKRRGENRKERVGEEGREDDLIGRATATWRKNSSRARRPTLLTMD